jgi:hypothetical protein
MGYEHYWSRPAILNPKAFAAWSRDVQKVVFALPQDMLRGETWDVGPTTSPTLVWINGNINHHTTPWAESDAGIPFAVPQTMDKTFFKWPALTDSRGWIRDSCKTNGKPYDIAVTASLILLAHHFPKECRVWSDGRLDDWQHGLALAQGATGLTLVIPIYEHTLQTLYALPPDGYAEWSHDIARIIRVAGVPLAGPDGTDEPIITPTLVAFNGPSDEGYDPFYLPCVGLPEWEHNQSYNWMLRRHRDLGTFLSVLTMGNAGKRYDIVVMAALLLCLIYFPDPIKLYSDGDSDVWARTCSLVQRATCLILIPSVDNNHRVTIIDVPK